MASPQVQPPEQPSPQQFYPIHPEFGYLVPALPLRRKAWLVCKAAAFGAAVGAIAVIALSDRDPARVEPVLTAHAEVTPVVESIAIPSAVIATPRAAVTRRARDLPQAIEAATAPTPVATPAPVPQSVPAMKPSARKSADASKAKKKQVARAQPRDPATRAAEPDPRSAYASPFRGSFEQPRRGWQGGWGQRGFGW